MTGVARHAWAIALGPSGRFSKRRCAWCGITRSDIARLRAAGLPTACLGASGERPVDRGLRAVVGDLLEHVVDHGTPLPESAGYAAFVDAWAERLFDAAAKPVNPLTAGVQRITAYCAEEVRRQQDTPFHVHRMLQAWAWALDHRADPIDHDFVQTVGFLVDEANARGYRDGPVWVGGRRCPEAVLVSGLMAELLRDQDTLEPDVFYRRFQEVHPFFDGNGRTGKVLLNKLRGTLLAPVWPKNWWGIANP